MSIVLPQSVGEVKLFDTTFRDGFQQGGDMQMSDDDALKTLRRLDEMGVHYAEIAFGGAHKFGADLIQAASKLSFGQLKLAVFGRTRKAKTAVKDHPDIQKILAAEVPVGVLVCKSRLVDVLKSLQTWPEENLAMIADSVQYLKSAGLEVILDLEHSMDAVCGRGGYGEKISEDDARLNLSYFWEVVDRGLVAGADSIVICDTTGGASPEEVAELFDRLTSDYPGVEFGFHGHNDNDLATANSRAAILHGARQIHLVINGHGERCGNSNACSLIPRLQLKDGIPLVTLEALQQITSLSRATANALNRDPSDRAPFVGNFAFGTMAGMHAAPEAEDSSGVRRNPGEYFQCQPEAVGNTPFIGVNRQSGASNIMAFSKAVGVPLNGAQAKEFGKRFKEIIEAGGFEISRTSFILACRQVCGDHQEFFQIGDFEVTSTCVSGLLRNKAEIRVSANGQPEEHIVANGDGPVDALAKAFCKALGQFYPAIKQVHLGGFNLLALNVKEQETGALVRVLAEFTCNGCSWETVGVSTNSN